MSVVDCLFIFSSKNPEVAETINSAIKKINATQIVNIRTTASVSQNSAIEMRALLNAIEKSDLVLCDLTILTDDTLFLLGYAASKNKPLWLAINSTFSESIRNFRRLGLISSLPYAEYQNSIELMNEFLREQPYDISGTTLNDELMQSMVQTKGKSVSLFYLKCEMQTEPSIHLTRRLRDTSIPLIIDDPIEVASQTLNWYAENLYHSYAVVAHLIDDHRRINTTNFQNEKYSFILGLAFGYDKKIFAVTHKPYTSKFEQLGFNYEHTTAAECVKHADTWIPNVESIYKQQQEEFARHKSELDTAVGLQRINLGEFVAEQEKGELEHYFIDTAAFKNALKASQYVIFVGRKGSGKTANLQQLNQEIMRNRQNHVSLITPEEYELEGVLELLSSNLSKADSGYLLESLWKYLIYTELARDVYKSLKSRPIHYNFDHAESSFVEFVDRQKDIQDDFTIRMEYAIQELCNLGETGNRKAHRAKVSEILHTELLGELQAHLGEVLSKKQKVYVLVDNLDKAWKNRQDIQLLSHFLFGLLNAGQTISSQLQTGGLRRKGINFILIIYLRSDIFEYIQHVTREKDKLSSERMNWNDPELLKQVIEKRFIHSIRENLKGNEIWEEYFVSTIKNTPTPEYILGRIIPRPRDMIYFCREALNQAINHKNTRIEESDIIAAEKNYSSFAFNALLAETDTQLPNIEELLYEFVGRSDILTESEIKELIRKAQIEDSQAEYAIDLLCKMTFLGIETSEAHFDYLYDSNKARVLNQQAYRLTDLQGEARYKVNIPFHSYLEINRSELPEPSTPENAHHHIITVLIPRMSTAFERKDYPEVIHASASIFETMAKHVIGNPSIENKTLGSFFESYRNNSTLASPMLDMIHDIYKKRNVVPLAGHGSTSTSTTTEEEARTVKEMTLAIVRIEYGNLGIS